MKTITISVYKDNTLGHSKYYKDFSACADSCRGISAPMMSINIEGLRTMNDFMELIASLEIIKMCVANNVQDGNRV